MSIDIGRLSQQAQKQILQKIGKQAREREIKSKYHAEKDTRGKIKFASKKEARRYDDLMLMLKAGRIVDLKLQPQFTLQESYVTPDGIRVRAIKYVADFSYRQLVREGADSKSVLVVEDTKSPATKTREYELKKKLLQEKFGITIREV